MSSYTVFLRFMPTHQKKFSKTLSRDALIGMKNGLTSPMKLGTLWNDCCVQNQLYDSGIMDLRKSKSTLFWRTFNGIALWIQNRSLSPKCQIPSQPTTSILEVLSPNYSRTTTSLPSLAAHLPSILAWTRPWHMPLPCARLSPALTTNLELLASKISLF
jgi:hypothetical protein